MNRFHKFIFPSGKVHKKYIQYIGWSFISNVFVSVENALATHSILHAIDNGSETIRTANYIGKDIIGQLGGLIYMSNMGGKADEKPRKFLLYSTISQQTAYMSLCTTHIFPEYFLPIAGFSNILSNISFTGFGAINAKCIQMLAIDNNIGEIYAKVSVFNTWGSSIGLLIGIGITAIVPDHNTRLCIIPFLAIARVLTFRRAICGII